MSVCEKEPCKFQSPTAAQSQSQPQPKPKAERVSKKSAGNQDDTPFHGVRKRRWGALRVRDTLTGSEDSDMAGVI
ncbi:hypothetical protein REPUB_Repub10bG0056000 [Reevesia pubescens]